MYSQCILCSIINKVHNAELDRATVSESNPPRSAFALVSNNEEYPTGKIAHSLYNSEETPCAVDWRGHIPDYRLGYSESSCRQPTLNSNILRIS